MSVGSPFLSIVSSEMDRYALGGNRSGSKERSLRNQTVAIPCLPYSSHPLNRTAFPEGVARAGVRASAAAFEYWPRSHGLLISSGFQAAGGSSGHSFQGAVALVPGRGLQEIAYGARQAEVLLGSGLELEEPRRSCGPAVLRANTRATAPPTPPPCAPLAPQESEPGPQGQPFELFRSESDFPAVRRPGPMRKAPRERRPESIGPLGDFSGGQSKGQVRRRRRLVQRVKTLQGS